MADEAQTGLTGGCQCGAVRYRLEAKPKATSICHCRMCQKASGGPFTAFGGLRLGRLVWTRGAPKVFASSDIAERALEPVQSRFDAELHCRLHRIRIIETAEGTLI